MIKTIKISINELLEFIDQDKLVDWVRGQKEIREIIDEVSKNLAEIINATIVPVELKQLNKLEGG